MTRDFGWDLSAQRYIELYESLLPDDAPDTLQKHAA
jgi:hypothetical protein